MEGGDSLAKSRHSVLVVLIHLSWAVASGAGEYGHFINPAESVNFKENHPRVYYLYMEHSQYRAMSSLSFNYSELT